MGIKGDLVLIQQAINKRWVTDGLKEDAMQTILDGLQSSDMRIRIRASEIVLAMESQNQKDEHHRAIIELAAIRHRLSVILNQPDVGKIGEQPVDPID